ncbi:helix-turn-helix domain-containing protein [Paracoccus sp. MBLB3053]|uniref:Helix-turn-helix domain-containing protein n=1 Tax=Paracoccus aurantius TaxID=3073814 RepID=A0ABU2HYC6_9RHOB|nr:helix-turn-helix domain-containing protein [Paracoccus sp. MBLB3053]MDS9470063.1 helix-turn-helix domain-containing protein [Paracoccus sp. MBLB3053]
MRFAVSPQEPRNIAKWREGKMPVPEIAERLARAPLTISRELKRNMFLDSELPQFSGDFAANVQNMYERRRARHRKLVIDPELKVEDALKSGWPPEQIAGRMRLVDDVPQGKRQGECRLSGRTGQPLHGRHAQ